MLWFPECYSVTFLSIKAKEIICQIQEKLKKNTVAVFPKNLFTDMTACEHVKSVLANYIISKEQSSENINTPLSEL